MGRESFDFGENCIVSQVKCDEDILIYFDFLVYQKIDFLRIYKFVFQVQL